MFEEDEARDVLACKNVFLLENGHQNFAAFTFVVVLDVNAAI